MLGCSFRVAKSVGKSRNAVLGIPGSKATTGCGLLGPSRD